MLSPLVTCRSQYTFLEGVHSVEEVVDFAVEKGVNALCLADRNGLYGAVEFYILCREAKIKPLIGTELVQNGRHVTLIARNQTGYEELSDLITRHHLGDLCIKRDLFPDSGNLLYLCGDPFMLARWTSRGRSVEKRGPLFVALTVSDRTSFRSMLNFLSRRTGLPRLPAVPVVKWNLFSDSDVPLYHIIRAIDLNCTVQTLPKEERFSQTETAHSSAAEFPKKIKPESIPYRPVVSGTDIAKMCNLELDLESYHLPEFRPPR